MGIIFLIKGITIGFAMAVPVGPIGIMCIRKTLSEGKKQALFIGLGAATADLFYGCVAAFGLTFISTFLYDHRFWIRLIGGCFLIFIGIKTFLTHPSEKKNNTVSTSFLKSYLTTVFITLTNPLTIFAFVAIFATLGMGKEVHFISAVLLVIGVFVGSLMWFLSLIFGISIFRKKFSIKGLIWVNRIAGIIIVISGVIAIISILPFVNK